MNPHTNPNLEILNPEDIRHFIWDRDLADNPMEMDLTFSDDEIRRAMRFAAMSFNAITPYVVTAHPDRLPASAIFLHGTVYHLYLSKLAQLSRNKVDYQAGGMNVDLKQIQYYQDLLKLHKELFEQAAKEYKLTVNISQGFGHF